MAETGWPLIPRELLPAPVPLAAKGRRAAVPHPQDGARQLSIFGAETTDTSPFDLAGLLAGPGRLERMGGTARVSVPVDSAWRVHVLAAELVTRGLVVNWRPLEEEEPPEEPADELVEVEDSPVEQKPRFEVRTAYSSRLNALATAWPAAADQLFLSGPRIRLWVAAAGAPDPGGFTLGLTDDGPLDVIDAALRRAGLDGTMSDHGRSYLITGRRRLGRLAELVGERPASAPVALWPGGAEA